MPFYIMNGRDAVMTFKYGAVQYKTSDIRCVVRSSHGDGVRLKYNTGSALEDVLLRVQ